LLNLHTPDEQYTMATPKNKRQKGKRPEWSPAPPDESKYNIVVVGWGGVGKSAITVRYMVGTFVEKYDPTVEDSYEKNVEVGGKACTLDIMDTAGQEDYKALRDSYMKKGEGFLLVFSLISAPSFDQAKVIRRGVLQVKEEQLDIPIMLLGNKCDLDEDREIPQEKAQTWATEVGIPYLETSAKTNINIGECFEQLVMMINQHRAKHPKVVPKTKGFCLLY